MVCNVGPRISFPAIFRQAKWAGSVSVNGRKQRARQGNEWDGCDRTMMLVVPRQEGRPDRGRVVCLDLSYITLLAGLVCSGLDLSCLLCLSCLALFGGKINWKEARRLGGLDDEIDRG